MCSPYVQDCDLDGLNASGAAARDGEPSSSAFLGSGRPHNSLLASCLFHFSGGEPGRRAAPRSAPAFLGLNADRYGSVNRWLLPCIASELRQKTTIVVVSILIRNTVIGGTLIHYFNAKMMILKAFRLRVGICWSGSVHYMVNLS